MPDFRLRRPSSAKSKTADTAARVAQVVGSSLREIRRSQGHSLDTLAAASGVSRAMLGQIETGKSVPTITVLWKVAAALGVPVAQLISDPEVSLYTVQRRKDANAETATSETRSIGPANTDAAYTIDEIHLSPGNRDVHLPRREGGSASLVVAEGAIEIVIGDEPPLVLEQGDAIHFSAGLKHTLANPGGKTAILYRVVGSNRKGQ